MNYEKAYIGEDGITLSGSIFPELKESEGEKIRKEMIFYFQEEIPQCSIQEHADKMKKFIAWLEKQAPKPKWTEEDECYMSECISAIATKDRWSFEEKRKTKHWLESLKEKIRISYEYF